MEPNAPPRKRKARGKLNQLKCDCCRHDKQKCDPVDRVWPQKCNRCEYKGFDCSENTRKKTPKPQLIVPGRPSATNPQPAAAETVDPASSSLVAGEPYHSPMSRQGEVLESDSNSGRPRNESPSSCIPGSDIDEDLEHIINAASFFTLTRRASMKLATQESKLKGTFPDFGHNQELLALIFATSLNLFRTQLLSRISDISTALGRQSTYSGSKSFLLEQAVCDIAVDPLATHKRITPGKRPYMSGLIDGVPPPVVTKTIVSMLAGSRPGRAIILLEDSVAANSAGPVGYDLADLFWDSFRSLRKMVKQSTPACYRDLPETLTDNPGFFGDTSWVFRLQDFAESQWNLRDCVGGLIHSLLEQLGRDEHQTIPVKTQERMIARIVTCMREETLPFRDIWGQTPLHYAARYDVPDLITGLLAAGVASPNETSNRGHTPLHYAAAIGNVEMCQLLISHGAGVNNMDLNGYTPLAYAAMKGHSQVLRLLLDQDFIDPNISCRHDLGRNTPAMLALKWGLPTNTCCQDLLHHPRSQSYLTDNVGHTVLHIAVGRGNITATKNLFAMGLSCSLGMIQDGGGRTAICLAAKIQDAALSAGIVSALLGETLFQVVPPELILLDNDNMSPLHYAARNGNLKACREIVIARPLAQRLELYFRCRPAGLTPRECAMTSGHVEVAKMLRRAEEEAYPF